MKLIEGEVDDGKQPMCLYFGEYKLKEQERERERSRRRGHFVE